MPENVEYQVASNMTASSSVLLKETLDFYFVGLTLVLFMEPILIRRKKVNSLLLNLPWTRL